MSEGGTEAAAVAVAAVVEGARSSSLPPLPHLPPMPPLTAVGRPVPSSIEAPLRPKANRSSPRSLVARAVTTSIARAPALSARRVSGDPGLNLCSPSATASQQSEAMPANSAATPRTMST